MSQPVKLSNEIVETARVSSKLFERSIAGQIEYWAQLGRAVENLLTAPQVIAMRGAGKGNTVDECLAQVGSEEGAFRLQTHLSSRPFPHYEVVPEQEGLFVRIAADGTRTRGRFSGREFNPE